MFEAAESNNENTNHETAGSNAQPVEQQIVDLRNEMEKLKEQLAFARGTRDVQAAAEPVKKPAVTLAGQIEQHLRERVLTTEELAKATGYPAERVSTIIKSMRAKVADIGTAERARWSWRLGPSASAVELRALVERLISFRPMEFQEIVSATGARESVVQGHLIEIRKSKHVLDFGTPRRGRWFLISEHARDARIAGRKTKKE